MNVPLLSNDPQEVDGEEESGERVQSSRRFKRDSVLEREFRPLRISLYFDPASIDPLPVAKQIFINVRSGCQFGKIFNELFSVLTVTIGNRILGAGIASSSLLGAHKA